MGHPANDECGMLNAEREGTVGGPPPLEVGESMIRWAGRAI